MKKVERPWAWRGWNRMQPETIAISGAFGIVSILCTPHPYFLAYSIFTWKLFILLVQEFITPLSSSLEVVLFRLHLSNEWMNIMFRKRHVIESFSFSEGIDCGWWNNKGLRNERSRRSTRIYQVNIINIIIFRFIIYYTLARLQSYITTV